MKFSVLFVSFLFLISEFSAFFIHCETVYHPLNCIEQQFISYLVLIFILCFMFVINNKAIYVCISILLKVKQYAFLNSFILIKNLYCLYTNTLSTTFFLFIHSLTVLKKIKKKTFNLEIPII